AGTYTVTRTWTFTDACGNTSSATQTINVIDNVAPVFGQLPAPSTVACPAVPEFAEPTVSDNCGGTVNLTSSDSTTPGVCEGTYTVTRTWTATDACGNIATAQQSITVTDTTAPVITAQATNLTVECDGNGNQAEIQNWLNNNGGAAASDACSNVTWTNNFTGISGDCSATATVTFTATDACGNTATTTATIQINDTTAPVAPTAPEDVTVSCIEDVPAMITLTAQDNCDGEITVTGTDIS